MCVERCNDKPVPVSHSDIASHPDRFSVVHLPISADYAHLSPGGAGTLVPIHQMKQHSMQQQIRELGGHP